MHLLRQLRRLFFAAGGLPIVWIGLTILVLVPIWHQRLLPHLDTPNHLALVRAWHSYHDASYNIAEYYRLRAADPDRWLGGMNKLQRAYEGGLS